MRARSLAALGIVAAAWLLATTRVAAAGPPAGVSATGKVVWNFEGLLGRTFGSATIGVRNLNGASDFVRSSGCPGAAVCSAYLPVFARHAQTAFHLVAGRPRGSFGNYPVLVRVQGDYVACNDAGTRFLIAYGDTINFGLACLAPLP